MDLLLSHGKIEKIFDFVNGEPLILDAYSKNGKPLVVNGDGNFKTDFSTYKQCDNFEASGDVLNGKKNGKWTFSNPHGSQPIAFEIFENGNFIKGNSNDYEYTDKPRMRLTKFYANENLNLLENYIGCPGYNHIFYWQYKDSDIHKTFYPELQEYLSKYNSLLKDQWLIIGIKIKKNNKPSEVDVSSSIDDVIIENYIYNGLLKMTDWKTAIINSNKVEANIFFSILIDKNQIIIPTDYLYRNREN